MFGYHPELAHRLRKHGTSANAKVLEAKQGHMVNSDGTGRSTNVMMNWTLKVEVQPTNEPAFEAKVDGMFNQFSNPLVGQLLPVLFDPKDHDKLVIDHGEDADLNAGLASVTQQLEKKGLHVDSKQLSSLVKQYSKDPDSVDPNAWATSMGLPYGTRTVNLTGAPEMTMGPDGTLVPMGGAAGAAAPGADPVQLLAQLAEMHKNGVVSDEEFAAQKKRLLGEGS